MNLKRWIAIIVAATLIVVSVGVNTLSYFFTRDFNSFFEEFVNAEVGYTTEVIESGKMNEQIAVLSVDGVIQASNTSLLGGVEGYNHGHFMSQLDDILYDESIKGMVLFVNSPGGGVFESSDIYDKIRQIQIEREIPIYISMGGIAASGGYYISAPADKIFVHPETLTGSIGVIMESINYSKLAEKVGIEFNTIKTGPYKDIFSSSREMQPEEKAMLEEMINDSYEQFVEIVAEGRGMTYDQAKKVADGRIVNARQAIESGLADDYGKIGDVIAAMKEDYGLENATVFEYVSYDKSLGLFPWMKSPAFFGKNAEAELIAKILSDYDAPRMMYLYGEY